jgi:glucokinase
MKKISFAYVLLVTLVNTITYPVTNIEFFRNGMESIHEYPTCFYGTIGGLAFQRVSADLEKGTQCLLVVANEESEKLMVGEISKDFNSIIPYRIESIEPNDDSRYLNVVISVANPNDEVHYTPSFFGLTYSIESIDKNTGIAHVHVLNGKGDYLAVGLIIDDILPESYRIDSIEPTNEDSTALVTLSPTNRK